MYRFSWLTNTADVVQYGFNNSTMEDTVFNRSGQTYNLSSPSLNISVFYLWEGIIPLANASLEFSENYTRAAVESQLEDLGDPANARFVRTDVKDNRTYDVPYLEENGFCQQQQTYQWGT